LPSVAAAAVKVAFSRDDAVVGWFSARLVVPQVAADALGSAMPTPATRADTTSAAIASRLTAARREAGARLARLRCDLLTRFRMLTVDLRTISLGTRFTSADGDSERPGRNRWSGFLGWTAAASYIFYIRETAVQHS
jgi:hypothetical protein